MGYQPRFILYHLPLCLYLERCILDVIIVSTDSPILSSFTSAMSVKTADDFNFGYEQRHKLIWLVTVIETNKYLRRVFNTSNSQMWPVSKAQSYVLHELVILRGTTLGSVSTCCSSPICQLSHLCTRKVAPTIFLFSLFSTFSNIGSSTSKTFNPFTNIRGSKKATSLSGEISFPEATPRGQSIRTLTSWRSLIVAITLQVRSQRGMSISGWLSPKRVATENWKSNWILRMLSNRWGRIPQEKARKVSVLSKSNMLREYRTEIASLYLFARNNNKWFWLRQNYDKKEWWWLTSSGRSAESALDSHLRSLCRFHILSLNLDIVPINMPLAKHLYCMICVPT